MLKEITTSLFQREQTTRIVECRRCGRDVSSMESTCPACDSEEMVEYTIK